MNTSKHSVWFTVFFVWLYSYVKSLRADTDGVFSWYMVTPSRSNEISE